MNLEVLCAKMALSSEEHLNVLLGRVEDRGEVAGGHLVGLALQKLVFGGEELVLRTDRTFGGRARDAIFVSGVG